MSMPIRCIYDIFSGREVTIHTVIYGVHLRFWPTLTTTGAPALYVGFIGWGQVLFCLHSGKAMDLFTRTQHNC
jgi:hypothetical protein